MYECFNCGHRAVIWDADFDACEVGYIDPGIVHICHCAHCGAQIEYYIKSESTDSTMNQ